MDDKLSKILEDFCKIRCSLNSGNVTAKTVSIIARFIKAVQIAEQIVANPPKRDTSFDPELHLKTSTYSPLKEEKEWAKPKEEVDWMKNRVKISKVKVPKKRGPKPKK